MPADEPIAVVAHVGDSRIYLIRDNRIVAIGRRGSVTIPRGAMVMPLLGSANHDPAVNPGAARLHEVGENPRHLAFGHGVHFCLGAPLARMELAESLAVLLGRFPGLRRAGAPEPRGTFVLRGHRSVPVAG